MIGPEFGALDRLCVIVVAIIFYMAIRILQNIQDDVSEIQRFVESSNERISKLEREAYDGSN